MPMMIKRACALAAALLIMSAPGRADSGWVAYRAIEHGFAASFPSTPKIITDGEPGHDPVMLFKFEATDSGRLFVVIVYEYGDKIAPPRSSPEVLDQFLKVYGSGSQTIPRDQHATTIAGQPAVEAVMEDPPADEYELVDISIVARRMFVIVSSGRKGHETSPEASRFRDSFQLISAN
jgi:hypothetical protein